MFKKQWESFIPLFCLMAGLFAFVGVCAALSFNSRVARGLMQSSLYLGASSRTELPDIHHICGAPAS